jgi:peptide/bleomycin uptake transporter
MFVQFFCQSSPKTRLSAWAGLIVVVAYSAFAAWTKSRINEFYSDFYNLLQTSVESGSGGFADDDPSPGALRAEVWSQLTNFATIVMPLIVASPVSKWVRSAWAFAWRRALMRSYLHAWNVQLDPIEGASQRLHEDSQRFCVALQGCLATVLDACFTLTVFAPILIELGHEIPPPLEMSPGAIRDGWLLITAYVAASIGLSGAMTFGRKLVDLEVNNQRVEAGLRRDLVILETSPDALFGSSADESPHDSPDQSARRERSRGRGRDSCSSPLVFFGLTLKNLAANYHALFRNFAALNLWLALFDQFMVLLPYAVAAPLLFDDDPERRITLGTLVKLSNSFDKVFGSLSVISENWSAVNEFRSVVRRLREFELRLFSPPPMPGSSSSSSSSSRTRVRSINVHHPDFCESRLQVDELPSATARLTEQPSSSFGATSLAARGGRGAARRAEEAIRSRAPSPAEVAAANGATIELVEAELSEVDLSARGGRV